MITMRKLLNGIATVLFGGIVVAITVCGIMVVLGIIWMLYVVITDLCTLG